jgi:hypothetical protein
MAGVAQPEPWIQLSQLLTLYEKVLTREPAERFGVDAWLISDLAASMSNGPVKLSSTIYPIYTGEWGHSVLSFVWPREERVHAVYGITLPGKDFLSEIKLLEYPWLCHEMGHNLLARCPGSFFLKFHRLALNFFRRMERKGLADSAEARQRASKRLAVIKSAWTPTVMQRDWVHEIIVDIISLWVCGPAFIAAFNDVIEHPTLNPFEANSTHPPYELRTKLVMEVGSDLGWKREVEALEKKLHNWSNSPKKNSRTNEYLSLINNDLVGGAVELALSGCKQWQLPLCTVQTLEDVRKWLDSGAPVTSTLALIIAAGMKWDQDAANYSIWQRDTVLQLASEIIL